MNDQPTHPRCVHTTVARACLAGLALTLAAGGCARTSADEALLEAKILATSPGAEGQADPFKDASTKMVEVLSPHADDVEAAAVVLSLAELGVAATDADDLRMSEADAFAKVRLAHTAREHWMSLNAQRLAAESIDVEEEVKEIDELVAELGEERVGVDANRTEIETELQALDDQIESLRARAAEQRDRAGEIELTLNRLPASEAVRAAERIREHTLEADGYEIEATRLQQTRNRVHSRALEARLKSSEIDQRVELLQQNRRDAIARRDAARLDAREAADLANSARTKLIGAVEDARAARDEATQTSERIARAVRESTQRAGTTQGAPKSTASLTAVAGNQMLGYLAWRRSAMLERVAQLEQSVGASLGDASISAAGDDTLAGAQQAFDAATSAYSSAASAARRVRPSDPNTRDDLSVVADRFERFAATKFGEFPNLTAPTIDADSEFEEFDDDTDGSFDDTGDFDDSVDETDPAGDDAP